MVARAKVKRSVVITEIRSIHAMSQRLEAVPELRPSFRVLAADLDALWTQFKFEDDAVLDGLTQLDITMS